jgi:ssDNA-binding Zn-finger/Zn-ribbon topoisomerase 1
MKPVKCSNCGCEFVWEKEPETKMGYVDCPDCGYWVDQEGKAFQKESEIEHV